MKFKLFSKLLWRKANVQNTIVHDKKTHLSKKVPAQAIYMSIVCLSTKHGNYNKFENNCEVYNIIGSLEETLKRFSTVLFDF